MPLVKSKSPEAFRKNVTNNAYSEAIHLNYAIFHTET